MAYTKPTVANFKDYFARDFPFGSVSSVNVLDSDVSRAQAEAVYKINEGCFSDQDNYTIGHHYITAHILVNNLRNSSQGLSSKFNWPENSKSVGSVSASYAIPPELSQNPYYAWFASTGYGLEYLMMIYPCLLGQIFTVEGATSP